MTEEEFKQLEPGDKLSVLFDAKNWYDPIKKEIQEYFDRSGKDFLTFREIHWDWLFGGQVLIEEANWAMFHKHIEYYESRSWSYELDY